ncbi:hypothetical protein PpBr36_07549 [Pyricularia pennisetigena]|uniref:hypothetical protein n=1 Tax=Pyricularia pennisetigena TaxID=1578925 RepID=UPI00115328F4|nr:hypothetical protein PpBr36_07549 [Pyricularia pennisetigena]TLS25624.1 hypothetical protein PpBr36_07549 [Pyricularia pennisetigena]
MHFLGTITTMTMVRQIALVGLCVLALLSTVALQTLSLGSNAIKQDPNSNGISQMPFLELRSEPELKLDAKRDDNQLPGLLGGVLNPLLGGTAPSTPAVPAVPAVPVLPSALPPVLPAPVNAPPAVPQVPATPLPIQQAPLPPAPAPAPAPPAQAPAEQGGGGILGGIIGGLLGGGNAPVPLPEAPLPVPALAPAPAVPEPAAPAVPGADALNILGGLGGLVTDVIGKTGVLQGVVNGAGPAAPGLGPIALPDVSDIMKAAESAVSDNVPIGDVVAAVAGKVMDTVNEVANTLVPVLNETTSAIVPLADGVSAVLQHPPIGDVLGKVVDTLADFTAQVVNVTTPVLDTVDNLVPLPVDLSNIVQGAAGAVNEVAKGVNELLCDVQGVDAVSVILRKPCTELAASFATILPDQSSLSIVVTTQTGTGNMLATVTNSAGSTILPILPSINSLQAAASISTARPLGTVFASPALPAPPVSQPPSILLSASSLRLSVTTIGPQPSSQSPTAPLFSALQSALDSAKQSLSASLASSVLSTVPAAQPSPSSASLVSSVQPLPSAQPAVSTWLLLSSSSLPSILTCYLDLALAEAILVTGAPAAGSVRMAYYREEIRHVAMAGHATTVSRDSSVFQILPPYPVGFKLLSSSAINTEASTACLGSTPGKLDGTPIDNGQCFDMCQKAGYKLAGTEDGTECYCGNYIYNSYLIDDSRCSSPCSGDSTASCGGPWALAIYSPDGRVEVKQPAFTLTEPPPGTPETTLHIGGIRQTVVPVTMPVYMWPPPAGNVLPPILSSSCTTATPTTSCTGSAVPSVDHAGLLSSVGAIVSDAMLRASSVESAVLSRASTAMEGAKHMVNSGISSVVGEMSSFISVVAHQTPNPLIGGMPGPVMPSCVGSGPGCMPAASGPVATGEPAPWTGNPSMGGTPGSGTPGSGTPGSGGPPLAGTNPGVPVIVTYGHSKFSNPENADEEDALNNRQRRHARGRIGSILW